MIRIGVIVRNICLFIVFSTSGGFEVTTVLSSTSAPPAPSSCASGFMGTVPHPDLCNSFFMCLGSAAIQMYCTSGHEYDAQLRTCVQLAPEHDVINFKIYLINGWLVTGG
ncbi:hypothetical protein evm_012067 [Chilo suppressalis]|nr:hypothetical protein evm_012067 [Chilo suppressalis]